MRSVIYVGYGKKNAIVLCGYGGIIKVVVEMIYKVYSFIRTNLYFKSKV